MYLYSKRFTCVFYGKYYIVNESYMLAGGACFVKAYAICDFFGQKALCVGGVFYKFPIS